MFTLELIIIIWIQNSVLIVVIGHEGRIIQFVQNFPDPVVNNLRYQLASNAFIGKDANENFMHGAAVILAQLKELATKISALSRSLRKPNPGATSIPSMNPMKVMLFHFSIGSAHPQMANVADIGVVRIILSSEFHHMHPKGTSSGAPTVKIFQTP